MAGHTALELPALTAALGRQGVPDPDAAVQGTLAEGEALVFQDALEEPGAPAAQDTGTGQGDGEEQERPVRVLVGLERYALAEESLADGLARLVNSVAEESGQPWETAAAGLSGGAAELARAVAGHGLVLHTGGEAARAEPAALLRCRPRRGLRAFAACHTPDGRRRLAAQLDGEPAEQGVGTVAGLLSGAEGPGRDADGALALDLLIVLDAPQLDVEGAAMLVESLPDGARLVLSGDPGVLWSAGPGRVFADLLAARICPADRLPRPGPRPPRRAGLRNRHRRAEPGRRPGQGDRHRAGAGRGRGRAPHGAAGRGLGAAGDRRPGRPDRGDHAGPRRRRGHPRPELRAEGAPQPRPRPVRRLRPRRPDRLLPRAGAHGAGRGGEGRRRRAAPVVRRRPRRRAPGAGGGQCPARLGADRAPGGGRPLAGGRRGPARRRRAGPQPPLGVHGVRPGGTAPVRGPRRGAGPAEGGRGGTGEAPHDPAADAAAHTGSLDVFRSSPGGGFRRCRTGLRPYGTAAPLTSRRRAAPAPRRRPCPRRPCPRPCPRPRPRRRRRCRRPRRRRSRRRTPR